MLNGTTTLALERIAYAKKTQAVALDLSGLNLEHLPEELEQLGQLQKLNISHNALRSLRGIEKLTALKVLFCSGNQLTELGPVQRLTALEVLHCQHNHLKQLPDLSNQQRLIELFCGFNGLTELKSIRLNGALKRLHCQHNRLYQLSDLEGLTALKELICGYNPVGNLRALAGLRQLAVLHCDHMHLASLQGLEALSQLKVLRCVKNSLSDLYPLRQLPQLTILDCSDNQLISLALSDQNDAPVSLTRLSCSDNRNLDLSHLPQLCALQQLDISACGLTALPDLSTLSQLHQLRCSKNQLQSLAGLAQLKQLAVLDCSNNRLTQTDDFRHLKGLNQLFCNQNQLQSLSGFSDLKALKVLDCADNKLTSLSTLSELSSPGQSDSAHPLHKLVCDGNPLRSLAGIDSLPYLTTLSCQNIELEQLTEVSELQYLQTLDCSDNRLTALSPVFNLSRLTQLNCSDNQLTSLDGIAALKPLRQLDCSRNQLTDLMALETLDGLVRLNCSFNQLTALTGCQTLGALKHLNCKNNQIHSLAALLSLTALESLNAAFNPLSCISELRLLCQVTDLTGLDIQGCHYLQLPSSILNRASLLKAYFAEQNTSDEPLSGGKHCAIKVLIVGNPGVGKSTLTYALKQQQPPQSPVATTRGVEVSGQTLQDEQGHLWQLRLWDFAGQSLYHSAHRLFFAPDALYLVLWSEQTEPGVAESSSAMPLTDTEAYPLAYWLDLIQLHGGDQAVTLLKNRLDQPQSLGFQHPALTKAPYNQYPHIGISARECQNIGSLISALKHQLSGLYQQRPLLPARWLAVMQKLAHQTQTLLPLSEFQQFCTEAEVEDQMALLHYLHNCGECLYLSGMETLVLDQNWAIDGIYRLFDHQAGLISAHHLIARSGEARHSELRYFLQDYSDQAFNLLLNYMLQSGLCFQRPENRNNPAPYQESSYVFPALLPAMPTNRHNLSTAELECQFRLPVLHPMLVERCIILFAHHTVAEQWWANGIEFHHNHYRARGVLVANQAQCHLTFYLSGQHAGALRIWIIDLLSGQVGFSSAQEWLAAPPQDKDQSLSQDWVLTDKIIEAHKAANPHVVSENGQIISTQQLYRRLNSKSTPTGSRARVGQTYGVQSVTYSGALSIGGFSPTPHSLGLGPSSKAKTKAPLPALTLFDAVMIISLFLLETGLARKHYQIRTGLTRPALCNYKNGNRQYLGHSQETINEATFNNWLSTFLTNDESAPHYKQLISFALHIRQQCPWLNAVNKHLSIEVTDSLPQHFLAFEELPLQAQQQSEHYFIQLATQIITQPEQCLKIIQRQTNIDATHQRQRSDTAIEKLLNSPRMQQSGYQIFSAFLRPEQ